MTLRIGIALLGLTLAACASKPKAPTLEGTEWRLVQLDGQAVMPERSGRAAHLLLQRSSDRAVGSGGCNRFTGGYQLHGDGLEIGPIVATKVACLDGGANETAFLATLERVRRWTMNGRQLLLADANGTVLLRLEAAGSQVSSR
jgi:heat shock protein HslJ